MSPFINKVHAPETGPSNCHFAIRRLESALVWVYIAKKAPHVHREHVEPFYSWMQLV